MRVAFVSLFTPHHGETTPRRRTHRVARLLAGRGHDVTWLCAKWWGGDHDSFEMDGITYRRVVTDPSPGRFAARLLPTLRRVAPDVVHAVNSPSGPAVAAAAAGSLLRLPVVLDWWCDSPDDAAFGYALAARGVDAVVTPSRTVKTRVLEHGARDETIRVVPESIDVDLVESAPVDDRFDIVYSRRLDRDANVETFLLGLAEIRDREWRAAVIGDGPERLAAERSARDLRIDDRVTFLGETPLEERVSVFKGAHIAVQTATREPFATDLLWALACGCVGLVEYQTDSGAHELVEGRVRANLVSSPVELAAAFLEAGDRPHVAGDGDFADYDHRAVLERFLACYRDVLDARGML